MTFVAQPTGTVWPFPPCSRLEPGFVRLYQRKAASEKWSYIDERDLQGWKADCVCMTCQHFAFGTDPHSFTLLGCNIRQKQLRQGDHLNKRCQLWAPTWQKEMGWEPWL